MPSVTRWYGGIWPTLAEADKVLIPDSEIHGMQFLSGASVLKYGLSRLAAPHGTVSVGEPRRAP